MKITILVLVVLSCVTISSCGGGSTAATTPPVTQAAPLSGSWNATLTVNGATSPQYTLGVAITQTGAQVTASSIPFTGPVGHGDSCFANTNFTGAGTVTGNNFTLALTDNVGQKLNFSGSFAGTAPASINATYATQYLPVGIRNPFVCTDVQGVISMAKQ
jgi:hypothetical protein